MAIEHILDLEPALWLDPADLRGLVPNGAALASGVWPNGGVADVGQINVTGTGLYTPPIFREDFIEVGDGGLLDAVEFTRIDTAASRIALPTAVFAAYTVIALVVPKRAAFGGLFGSNSNFAALSSGWGYRASGGVVQQNIRQDNAQLSYNHTPVVGEPIAVAVRNQTGGRTLFVNGVAVATDAQGRHITPNGGWSVAHGPYVTGDDPLTSYLDGYLLGFAAFTRVLSDDEVADAYAWMIGGMVAPAPASTEELAGPRIEYGAGLISIDFPDAGRWREGKDSDAGHSVTPSGARESYVRRREYPLTMPLRWHDRQHADVMAWLAAMEDDIGAGFTFYPHANDLAVSFSCYLTSPTPGGKWAPDFDPYDEFWSGTFEFVRTNGQPFNLVRFE